MRKGTERLKFDVEKEKGVEAANVSGSGRVPVQGRKHAVHHSHFKCDFIGDPPCSHQNYQNRVGKRLRIRTDLQRGKAPPHTYCGDPIDVNHNTNPPVQEM